MKKKKNKILAFICTLAVAFCGVLGLNLINNVDNVSADAAETEITDLTGTRWYFNQTLDFSAFNGDFYVAFDLDFALVSDGTSFMTFGVEGGDDPYLRYVYLSGSSISAFRSGSWYGSKYENLYKFFLAMCSGV
ncbi:MAG: hypothetical protein J6D30_04785 [Clostridia bacterium]|nr:hypothetical protein [Clostridia bacterium]